MTMSAEWLIEESLGGVSVVSGSSLWADLICNKNVVGDKQNQNCDCGLKTVHSKIERTCTSILFDVFVPYISFCYMSFF